MMIDDGWMTTRTTTTTRAIVDGTPDRRRSVGVGEEMMMLMTSLRRVK